MNAEFMKLPIKSNRKIWASLSVVCFLLLGRMRWIEAKSVPFSLFDMVGGTLRECVPALFSFPVESIIAVVVASLWVCAYLLVSVVAGWLGSAILSVIRLFWVVRHGKGPGESVGESGRWR